MRFLVIASSSGKCFALEPGGERVPLEIIYEDEPPRDARPSSAGAPAAPSSSMPELVKEEVRRAHARRVAEELAGQAEAEASGMVIAPQRMMAIAQRAIAPIGGRMVAVGRSIKAAAARLAPRGHR